MIPRTKVFFLVELHEDHMGPLLQPNQDPSSEPTAPLILASSANLLRVHSIPLLMLLFKRLNNIGSSTDSWGTSLITHFHLDIQQLTITLWTGPFIISYPTAYPSNPYLSNLAARILSVSPLSHYVTVWAHSADYKQIWISLALHISKLQNNLFPSLSIS